ncbi:MAG: VTT domain-containing protein [Candidatus Nanopelagicales bacterium]|nr:VTT domain-containing protein [Candidatus Nanopelagicales bacterium]
MTFAPLAALPALVPALGPEWLDPQNLERFGTAAFWIAMAIVFAECGLLIGFFLPGDSLLFMIGLFIASGVIAIPLPVACLLLTIAAVAGNLTGYWIGYRAGPPLFTRPDSRLFKHEHVEKTHAFFERYGARAIVLARFVPIVRTFITAMAGVGRMDFRTYALYSTIGGVLWATGVTVAGYFLGTIPFVKEHIELILLGIVAVSVVPIAIEAIRHRREARILATEVAAAIDPTD